MHTLYIPRGERDVIRLRNPTEDTKGLSTFRAEKRIEHA